MFHRERVTAALEAKADRFASYETELSDALAGYEQALIELADLNRAEVEARLAGVPWPGARPTVEHDQHLGIVVPFDPAQGRPFGPEEVGSHWSRQVQADVVAVDWREREILLGECKWGADKVGRSMIRELVETKTPKVLKELPDGEGWKVHYAFFARVGFTDAARAEAEALGALLVDLERLDADLRQALEKA